MIHAQPCREPAARFLTRRFHCCRPTSAPGWAAAGSAPGFGRTAPSQASSRRCRGGRHAPRRGHPRLSPGWAGGEHSRRRTEGALVVRGQDGDPNIRVGGLRYPAQHPLGMCPPAREAPPAPLPTDTHPLGTTGRPEVRDERQQGLVVKGVEEEATALLGHRGAEE